MICSTSARYFENLGGLYITQSNIYDGAFIAKLVSRYVYSQKAPS